MLVFGSGTQRIESRDMQATCTFGRLVMAALVFLYVQNCFNVDLALKKLGSLM